MCIFQHDIAQGSFRMQSTRYCQIYKLQGLKAFFFDVPYIFKIVIYFNKLHSYNTKDKKIKHILQADFPPKTLICEVLFKKFRIKTSNLLKLFGLGECGEFISSIFKKTNNLLQCIPTASLYLLSNQTSLVHPRAERILSFSDATLDPSYLKRSDIGCIPLLGVSTDYGLFFKGTKYGR